MREAEAAVGVGAGTSRIQLGWVQFKFRQTSACGTSCDIPGRHAFAYGSYVGALAASNY